ncbi:MAG: LicD family protein [Peptoniphilaceae bacterium]|uniref:LicD family protein n=1 Tax=Parvimonas sp. TaxID=1944660 RepID=UPI0025D1C135|nr:LicD family protein [Parvimonas sp.]MCI5997237.1 LicD family protein [Parvimonas sp.]MDD7764367.1 LicD family protein [Peptoniphilaceae bacterium]MDY3050047.1 LicD family protein [Parvimonas sp.]
MENIDLRELQLKSLEMAKYFVNFCKENNLLCYLCGGGAIGSLRHGGFIPWDDDLDFFMPRDDYEKLVILWNERADVKKYTLVKADKNLVDHNLFITIRDNETTAIKPYQKGLEISHGVALDILPLDGCPTGSFQRKMQIVWGLVYSLFCAQVLPEKHGGLKKKISKVLLSVFKSKNIRYKIWKFAERKMTKYSIFDSEFITELCSGPYYMKKVYKKEWFTDNLYIQFEDTKMPIPIGYDGYLKTAFGDYMKLPPKEKQVPHHDLLFLDLKKGYKSYPNLYK